MLFNELELLTNAPVVDDAIRFVSSHGPRNNQKSFYLVELVEEEEEEQDEGKTVVVAGLVNPE
jgi:hypothetical protein